MRYVSGDTANHDHEVDEAAWFEVRAAKKALKYVNEKRLIDLGLEYLVERWRPTRSRSSAAPRQPERAELVAGDSQTR